MEKLILVLSLLALTSQALADKDRGGGDLCEDRIQVIRADIKFWIRADGPKDLKLPASISKKYYVQSMLSAIATSKASCVKPGDKNYPVTIGGTPKVCAFSQKNKRIVCDYNAFMSKATMPDSDQYVLIHHEFAGLAKLENPSGDVSSYTLSNQISGFLQDVTIKKLAVRGAVNSDVRGAIKVICNVEHGYTVDQNNKGIPRTIIASIVTSGPMQKSTLALQVDQLETVNKVTFETPDEDMVTADLLMKLDGKMADTQILFYVGGYNKAALYNVDRTDAIDGVEIPGTRVEYTCGMYDDGNWGL